MHMVYNGICFSFLLKLSYGKMWDFFRKYPIEYSLGYFLWKTIKNTIEYSIAFLWFSIEKHSIEYSIAFLWFSIGNIL